MATEYFEYDEEPAVVEKASVSSITLEMPPEIKPIPKKTSFFQPPECATIMFRKARKKPPKIVITYDREQIRNKIERLTFAQARRLMAEIYEPVIEELYEAASPCWALHFTELFKTEKQLREDKVIKETLNDDRKLLEAMIDKVKMSDKALATPATQKYGYQHLYDLMVLLEPYKGSFDWLLKNMYLKIAEISAEAEDLDRGCYEILAKIFLKYGHYLDAAKDYAAAEYWLEKAFKLARGELWPTGIGECNLTLHELLAPQYSEILLKRAKLMISDNFDNALALVHQAILVVCEVGIQKFRKEFCRAHLVGGTLLAEHHFFDESLEFLFRVEEMIHGEDEELEKMLAEYNYTLGVCYLNLNLYQKSLSALDIAIKKARKFGQRQMEAFILLVQGRLINIYYKNRCSAIQTLEQSAEIFKEIGDIENEKLTKYLLATLQSEIIFPYFMDLVKGIEEENTCATYKLRQWKNLRTPFWLGVPEDFMTPVDPLFCLLKEDA